MRLHAGELSDYPAGQLEMIIEMDEGGQSRWQILKILKTGDLRQGSYI